jgi:hypothetical protein
MKMLGLEIHLSVAGDGSEAAHSESCWRMRFELTRKPVQVIFI